MATTLFQDVQYAQHAISLISNKSEIGAITIYALEKLIRDLMQDAYLLEEEYYESIKHKDNCEVINDQKKEYLSAYEEMRYDEDSMYLWKYTPCEIDSLINNFLDMYSPKEAVQYIINSKFCNQDIRLYHFTGDPYYFASDNKYLDEILIDLLVYN